MLNPELSSYITQKLAAGEEGSTIMEELLRAGWKREDILKSYLHVITAVSVAPPLTGSSISKLRKRFTRATIKRKRLFTLGLIVVAELVVLLVYRHYSQPMLLSPSSLPASPSNTTPAISTNDVPANSLNNINPTTYLTTWNFDNLPAAQRAIYYKATTLPNGTTERQYWFTATQKTITIASGIHFKAIAYDGQVPGPTLRANQGDTIVVHFKNDTNAPHTMDFGAYHPTSTNSGGIYQPIQPGGTTTYTFTASTAGLSMYTDGAEPMIENIYRGMHGDIIVDSKTNPQPPGTKDFVMTMDAFDVSNPLNSKVLKQGDVNNGVYTVNAFAFWYVNHPINIKVGQLYRVYLTDMTMGDPINSFHLHGNFYFIIPGGNLGSGQTYTDTDDIGNGDADILQGSLRAPGYWMFHSHKTEFTEKGWTGYFHATN